MTKEMRKFKIIISIVLGITILWTAFISAAFLYHNKAERDRREGEFFGLYVCGIPVRYRNAADVLGDGTVVYDPSVNILTLNNAKLDYDGSAAIFSDKDLTIALNGENRIYCTGPEASAGIYASDYMLRKDISFVGPGSLIVEGNGGENTSVSGIVADHIWHIQIFPFCFLMLQKDLPVLSAVTWP